MGIRFTKTSVRYPYIDNLRVFAFLVLIFFHASRAFIPGLDWLINDTEKSVLLAEIMRHSGGWRLPLLFFVSGMGTYFAFRSKSAIKFLQQRIHRLLLPLLFGMAVIVVPQVWYERMVYQGYQGGFFEFWSERYFTEGKYPSGQFTWAHLWFVGYLVTMTVGLLPIFMAIESRYGAMLRTGFGKIANSKWIYALFLLPLVLYMGLSPWYARQTNALYNDLGWFMTWVSWFTIGYMFALMHEQTIATIKRLRWLSLGLAVIASVALYWVGWTPKTGLFGEINSLVPIYNLVKMPFAWFMILTLTGFFAQYLNKANRFLSWANQGVFAFYIIHQTIIVAALYYVIELDMGVWGKFALISIATIIGSVLFFELARLLPASLQPLVGVSPKKKSVGARPLPHRNIIAAPPISPQYDDFAKTTAKFARIPAE